MSNQLNPYVWLVTHLCRSSYSLLLCPASCVFCWIYYQISLLIFTWGCKRRLTNTYLLILGMDQAVIKWQGMGANSSEQLLTNCYWTSLSKPKRMHLPIYKFDYLYLLSIRQIVYFGHFMLFFFVCSPCVRQLLKCLFLLGLGIWLLFALLTLTFLRTSRVYKKVQTA